MRSFLKRTLIPLKQLSLWMNDRAGLDRQLLEMERRIIDEWNRQRLELEQRIIQTQRQDVQQIVSGELSSQLRGLEQRIIQTHRQDVQTIVADEVDRFDRYTIYHSSNIMRCIGAISKLIDEKVGEPGVLQKKIPNIIYTSRHLDAIIFDGGYDLVVPTQEAGLLSYLTRHGFEGVEPAVRAALKRYIRPGMTVVDAGANLGIHSLVMASAAGANGKLIAFEPLPHLVEALRRSLLLNGLSDRSTVVQAALSDDIGEAVMHAAEHSPVSSLYRPLDFDTHELMVTSTTLDIYFDARTKIDLIKMDIEGAEPIAWRGMKRLLSDNPEVVVVLEWSASHFARAGTSASSFMDEVRAAGFKPWILNDEAPETPKALDPATAASLEAANLLLIRDNTTPSAA